MQISVPNYFSFLGGWAEDTFFPKGIPCIYLYIACKQPVATHNNVGYADI
jgi:hypothetical protein